LVDNKHAAVRDEPGSKQVARVISKVRNARGGHDKYTDSCKSEDFSQGVCVWMVLEAITDSQANEK